MKTLCALLLLLALPVTASEPVDPPFSAARGAFLAVSVADIEASSKWYQEKLGLKVTMAPQKYGKTTAMALEGNGLIVELIHNEDAAPAKGDSTHGVTKAGLIVDDFDKTVETLKARGVPIFIGPFPPRKAQRANFIIKDNSGNLIQFFGDYGK